MTIDKAQLKALAEAANAVTSDVNITMAVGTDPDEVKAVQDYLQVAMPKTILALIVEIERMEEEFDKAWRHDLNNANNVQALSAEVSRLQRESEALRKALLEASEEVATWGAYASEYFQKKHDLSGCVAKIHAAAMGKEASQ
ncbi:hypothetical protein GEV39_16655 [Pseudomonas sp. NY5710]|uniref:hypothetical protein n=1 Tax=Pseudomonas sp. NY5710 TaxID=2662033 RepID=UPI00156FE84B|nr:hypothetical protein [Pseudomonas sp. NY5710]QKL02910.1 hypothetical protein GEV39_16655 [Pseudomonas sp. NY5710]